MGEAAVKWGHYTAVTLLRHGPAGSEYEARDTSDGERVVVVVAGHDGGEIDKATTRDFLDRATAATQLDHPRIVSVRETGVDHATGRPFVVLVRPAGRTVAELLRDGSTFSPLEVASLGASVAEVLEYAHRLGIVHAHLTPERLIMTGQGTVAVDGFALLPPPRTRDTRAELGPVAGGTSDDEATVRGDLFALGAILYRLATGVDPFDRIGTGIPSTSPPPPSQLRPTLPPALGAAIFRLVQADPAKRPASAGEVARFLEGVRRGILGEAAGPSARAFLPPGPANRRVGVRVAVGLGAVGFLLLVALLALLPRSRPPSPTPPPPGLDRAARNVQPAAIQAALDEGDIVAARRLLAELEAEQGHSAETADLRIRVESRAAELAGRLFASGVAAMGSEHWEEASDAFRAVLVLQPDHADARRYLGAIRDRQLAEARASSIPAPRRAPRPAAPREGPTLGVYFDSPLPAGRIDLTLDGQHLDTLRFDFARSAFMGLQRRATGLVRRSWPLEVGDHRLTVTLDDAEGRELREETFNLSVQPATSFLIRIEMAGSTAVPAFILVPEMTD